jgi:protein TonB
LAWLEQPAHFRGETVVIVADFSQFNSAAAVDAIEVEVRIEEVTASIEPTALPITRHTPQAVPVEQEHVATPEIVSPATAEPLPIERTSAESVQETLAPTETQPKVARSAASVASPAAVHSEPQALGNQTSDQPAQLSSSPAPRYPVEWQRQGWSGTVLLRLTIGPAGRVEQVELESSSGFPELDRSAMQATRQWTGRPRLLNGKAVASQVLLPVVFDSTK